MALVDLLERRRQKRGGEPFLHADGATWSAGALAARADAAAGALAAAGVRPGDRVAVMLDNSADFVAAFFGIARIGAVAVTVNTALRSDGLAYVLGHAGPRVLIVDAAYETAARDAGEVEHTWVSGGSLEAALEGRAPPTPVRRQPGDVAAILYTSGTTGRPKSVMLTDHGYERASAWFAEALRLGRDDVLHTCLPLFHINAQQLSLCGALSCGAQLVLDRRFSASRFWDSITAHGVTTFNLVGAMLGILHAQEPQPEERAHGARVACVAPVPASIHRACEERFGLMLLDGYGLTETTPGNTYSPYGRAREGSCGTPAPYVELRIADEHGDELPPRSRGEILIGLLEPDILMAGYYRDPAATAAAARDGWFHTGDRGWVDEDGYLYFVDRLKDVIRRRGENISPVEIERAAVEHPAVAVAAAVGVPSDLAGGEEDVALYVLLRAGGSVEPAELRDFCAARLAAFMVPRYVGIPAELPWTETQRVRKVALRERGVEGLYDAAATPAEEARA